MSCLERMGHEVCNFDDRTYLYPSWKGSLGRVARRLFRARGIAQFNDDLFRCVAAWTPDLMLVFKGPALRQRSVLEVRRRGGRVVVLYPDLAPDVYGAGYIAALRMADEFLHTKPGLVRHFEDLIGSQARCVAPFYYRRHLSTPCDGEGLQGPLFVGHWSPRKEEMIRRLSVEYSGQIRIFGAGWRPYRAFAPNVALSAPLYGPPIRELYRRATGVLGLLTEKLQGFQVGDTITARTIAVPTSGGVLVHLRTPDAEACFGRNHPLLVDSIGEMASCLMRLEGEPAWRRKMWQEQCESAIAYGTELESLLMELLIECVS